LGKTPEPDPVNSGGGNGTAEISGLYSFREEAFLFDMENKMKISINGEERETDKATVALLLDELGILPGRVAVEVNLKIIRKADYVSQGIKDGDSVEIVNFVGGG
jgi:sulfur carrier protein